MRPLALPPPPPPPAAPPAPPPPPALPGRSAAAHTSAALLPKLAASPLACDVLGPPWHCLRLLGVEPLLFDAACRKP
eukprot:2822547-Prymnesium_polylepis.2